MKEESLIKSGIAINGYVFLYAKNNMKGWINNGTAKKYRYTHDNIDNR